MKFSELKTPEEVLNNSYISYIGSKSIKVKLLDKYRDSDGNLNNQGFEITWDNGNVSKLTYWEGDNITVSL